MDEGAKALEKRQKHIKVVDWLDYGWATVQHYEMDYNDEKHLEKAEKDAERAVSKR